MSKTIYCSPGWSNEYGLPAPLCRAIEHQAQAHKRGEGVFRSVTELIDSPLIHYLWKHFRDSVTIDYSTRLWALYGSIAHSIVEKFGGEGEEHVERKVVSDYEVDGELFKISGTIDYIKSGGALNDYKFTSTYSADGRDEWFDQQNTYLNLIHRTDKALGDSLTEVELCLMFRDWGPRFKEQGIPKVKMLPVPLLGQAEIEAFIADRIRIHRDSERSDEMPPQCTEEERWIRPEVFKVLKPGQKRSKANFYIKDFPSIEDARHAAENAEGKGIDNTCEVVLCKSKAVRCEEYCDVRGVCPYYKAAEPSGENEEQEWL